MAKNKKGTISDMIGPIVVDHHAYLTRTGKLDLAVRFFVDELRWVEDGVPVSGDWGSARFVRQRNTTSVIQLSEYSSRSDLPECSAGQHLALAVMIVSAETAIAAIRGWAENSGLAEGLFAEKANATGSRWFVYIPALFTFALEVVEVEAFRTS